MKIRKVYSKEMLAHQNFGSHCNEEGKKERKKEKKKKRKKE